jgi:hypothetical protein
VSWRLRFSLWTYAVGAGVMEGLLLLGAYQSGGFERSHGIWDLVQIGIYHVVIAALWPLVVVMIILQLVGLLPRPISF